MSVGAYLPQERFQLIINLTNQLQAHPKILVGSCLRDFCHIETQELEVEGTFWVIGSRELDHKKSHYIILLINLSSSILKLVRLLAPAVPVGHMASHIYMTQFARRTYAPCKDSLKSVYLADFTSCGRGEH